MNRKNCINFQSFAKNYVQLRTLENSYICSTSFLAVNLNMHHSSRYYKYKKKFENKMFLYLY